MYNFISLGGLSLLFRFLVFQFVVSDTLELKLKNEKLSERKKMFRQLDIYTEKLEVYLPMSVMRR